MTDRENRNRPPHRSRRPYPGDRADTPRGRTRMSGSGERPSQTHKPGARPRRRRRGLIPAFVYAVRHIGNSLIHSPILPIGGGLLLVGLVLYAGIWFFTNKNAYDVYVDDTFITSIAKDNDVAETEKWIYDNALAKLSSDLGAKVQVDLTVKITPENRARNKLTSLAYAIERVYQEFNASGYKLDAVDVVVNDVTIVTLRSEAEAHSVFDTVMQSYVPAGATAIEKDWYEDTVVAKQRFADKSEIQSAEQAINALKFRTETESMYQVRSGESIWLICRKLGLTQDRLVELNPDVPEVQSGNIRAGQMIKVITPKPLCSVRTVEEVIYTDVEKFRTEERPIEGRTSDFRRVLQEGRDGTREVLAHVTRINGVETGDRVEISSKTLIAPVLEIVEVGSQ